MLWSACSEPTRRPVSCCGKKPFGTMIEQRDVQADRGEEDHQHEPLWRSAQPSECP